MPTKILTVDDSKTVRIIVKKSFKNFSCSIFEAGNGAEGLAAAARELPDLILLDVTMPVMDGLEMLTKLKADPALQSIPVVMLTAEGGQESVNRTAQMGAQGHLVKPFTEAVLIEKCSQLVALQALPAA